MSGNRYAGGQADDQHRYDDIIDLPHYVSATRPQMSVWDRSAQFSPFAALTGHGAAIDETARLTDERVELTDTVKQEIDNCLQYVRDHIGERPLVVITYFVEDHLKDGGAYLQTAGEVVKIEEYEGRMILSDGKSVSIKDIVGIQLQ